MAGPLGFAVVLFAGATAYLTYATDSAERGGLGPVAGPAVFLAVGTCGMAGLWTGDLTRRVGPGSVAAAALVLLGAALTMLGLGSGSLPVVLLSAAALGAANTVGSAVLPIWTAQLAPDHPATAFTATLVLGSVSAVATPALIGALLPHTGLAAILLAAASLSVIGGVLVATAAGPRS